MIVYLVHKAKHNTYSFFKKISTFVQFRIFHIIFAWIIFIKWHIRQKIYFLLHSKR